MRNITAAMQRTAAIMQFVCFNGKYPNLLLTLSLLFVELEFLTNCNFANSKQNYLCVIVVYFVAFNKSAIVNCCQLLAFYCTLVFGATNTAI